ncbi:MAG: hypothetical protein HY812_12345 [Planctomycetes bacterium]|nr:hypothetical protein [Planctomycetota bacterium]
MDQPGIALLELDGRAGRVRVALRADCREDDVLRVLLDPDAFVPPPRKRSQERKAARRRAVHSFGAELCGRQERLYLKLYRVRTLKDVLEELFLGKRALRSLRTALEAERRGIAVPRHLGASHRKTPARWPARSVLLMLGVPHNRDVRTVLKHDLQEAARAPERRRLLRELGRFAGDAHARGLVHSDLKIRNVFVRRVDPPDLVLIDFDRARFLPPGAKAGLARQARDLRTLLASLRGKTSPAEWRRVLAAYLRARRLPRSRRRRLLCWAALLGLRAPRPGAATPRPPAPAPWPP